jgi:hypothetical protein
MSDTTTNKGEELYQSKIEEVNKERLYSREEVDDMMKEVQYNKFFTGVCIGFSFGIIFGLCIWSLITNGHLIN